MRFARVANGVVVDFLDAADQADADQKIASVPLWVNSIAVAQPPPEVSLGTAYDVASGFVLPVPVQLPQKTIEQLRADAQLLVIDWASNQQEAAVQDYTAAERKTWPEQEAEAKAYLASNNPADAPILAQQVAATNASGGSTTLAALCQHILGTATQLRVFSAAVRGIRQAVYREIETATDLTEYTTDNLDQRLQQVLAAGQG